MKELVIDETFVGWEQTLTKSVDGNLQGFWVYLDRNVGTELQSDSMGPATAGIVYLPGPIMGVRYKYDEVIESLQFYYDACWCEFESSPKGPFTNLMGDYTDIKFS